MKGSRTFRRSIPTRCAGWFRMPGFVAGAFMFVGCWVILWPALDARGQKLRHLDQVHEPRRYENLEAWLGRAAELRRHILVSTGLHPMPERTPLSPRLGEPIEREGYSVGSVVLETLPGFFLTGNLYRPLGESAAGSPGDARRHPAILSAHGHWQGGRFEHGELASVPGRAVELARRGYVVFSYSMVGYDETARVVPHRFAEPVYELWGFTPMGLQLWNSIRALDFVAGLAEVDPTRIGMTGASGGATQTFMLTAVDDRIRVAAPVNMISAHMQGGCVCENAPLLRLDANNVEIGALAAPRPLLMVSTSGDWTVNTPSVEYPAVRAVYALFGAEDRIRNVHLDYPHNYNRESREAVYGWFDRWLMGRDRPPAERPFSVEDTSVPRAEISERAADLETLFRTFRSRAEQQIEAARPAGWRDLFRYREDFGEAFRHVFHAVPDDGPHAIGVHVPPGEPLPNVGSMPGLPDAESPGRGRHLPDARTQAGHAVLIVHTDSESDEADSLRARWLAEGAVVFLLRPDGIEFAAPDSIEHWTTYNATTTARRVDAIRRTVEEIQGRPDVTGLDVIGLGAAGPWTFLARALVEDVRSTYIDFNGFQASSDAAFAEELFVPLLRRAGDFRTAAALIAPAHLDIHSIHDEPLRRWIESVYAAAGAREMLRIDFF